MLLTRAIALLSVITAVATADLVPVSPYIGKHKTSCNSFKKLTGALVGSKIYTFGGCYAIPYIVNPDDDDDIFRNFDDHQNVTESSHVYDITTDQWSFETNTPRPLQGSSVSVVGQDIYFYNIHSKPRSSQLDLWKYSTNTKEWVQLPLLPFLKHGSLLTCHSNNRMYFMGSGDGYQRNIIHVHNLATNSWEDSIYLDKRVNAKRIICHDTHISMIGEQVRDENERFFGFLEEKAYTQNLIDAYYNGTVHVVENFNVTLGNTRFGKKAQIAQLNEWFYTFSIDGFSKNETIITKINSLTLETIKLDTLPYTLRNVLILPTENNEIYLWGGAKENKDSKPQKQEKNSSSTPIIKTYNHKLTVYVKNSEEVIEASEEASKEAEIEKEEHRFNLQVPLN
jgi:hypothetical protein